MTGLAGGFTRRSLHWLLPFFLLPLAVRCWAHDIPNQRVDRSIQATLHPGRLRIDYEVSLTELTLTQDLRQLIGSLPGGDRSTWLNRYGEVTGPLNAKGFLISCDGRPLDLSYRSFDLVVEEHPRYTFYLESALPESGRLIIHDTNYVSSEGTSRLAVRGQGGMELKGDDLPETVADLPIKPVWELGDDEERRTRKVEVAFRGPASAPPVTEEDSQELTVQASTPRPPGSRETNPLSGLLDQSSRVSWVGLFLIAAGLGAVHAIQPGHGKTMVSAIAIGPQARWYHPALLGLMTALAHTGSVLVIAGALWWTGASQVAGLHVMLVHLAGFAIAAGGFLRIGRAISRLGEHEASPSNGPLRLSLAEILGLGLAGGIIPCWDAIGLVVLATALGRLGTGVFLVTGFGIGMAAVLVAVGVVTCRLKSSTPIAGWAARWEVWLELGSGLLLVSIGLFFFLG